MSGPGVTELLKRHGDGDSAALGAVMPMVYDELRALAHRKLRYERSNHTLNTTALVNEAYLKLVDQRQVDWEGRTHFMAISAQAMRRILINYARARSVQKRGGNAPHEPLDEEAQHLAAHISDRDVEELMALDDALKQLEEINSRGARVVELKYFGGRTFDEIAQILDLSTITVRRAWTAARAWLRRAMETE